uniref:Uncharacterized protein n=1 Tax=Bracon brevicornis TaxID=1563983 RepID=A0A6V7ISF7_9HYME
MMGYQLINFQQIEFVWMWCIKRQLEMTPIGTYIRRDIKTLKIHVQWNIWGEVDRGATCRTMYYAGCFKRCYYTWQLLCNLSVQDCIEHFWDDMHKKPRAYELAARSMILKDALAINRGDGQHQYTYWALHVCKGLDRFLNSVYEVELLEGEVYDIKTPEEYMMIFYFEKQIFAGMLHFWNILNDEQRNEFLDSHMNPFLFEDILKYKATGTIHYFRLNTEIGIVVFILRQLFNYKYYDLLADVIRQDVVLRRLACLPTKDLLMQTWEAALGLEGPFRTYALMSSFVQLIDELRKAHIDCSMFEKMFKFLWMIKLRDTNYAKLSLPSRDVAMLWQNCHLDILSFLINSQKTMDNKKAVYEEMKECYINMYGRQPEALAKFVRAFNETQDGEFILSNDISDYINQHTNKDDVWRELTDVESEFYSESDDDQEL